MKQSEGGTATEKALQLLQSEFSSSRKEKTAFLFTDGNPNSQELAEREAQRVKVISGFQKKNLS